MDFLSKVLIAVYFIGMFIGATVVMTAAGQQSETAYIKSHPNDSFFNPTPSGTNFSQDDNFTYTFSNGTTIINRNSTAAKLWTPWRFITG